MKATDIHFFSLEENQVPKDKTQKATQPRRVILTGYISTSGKLMFSTKAVAELGIDAQNRTFKVGILKGKRKAESLYLVSAEDNQADTFQLEKSAKGYTLALPVILKKSGINFSVSKYSFVIELLSYEGSVAFELRLQPKEVLPKVPYTGKPRGRKPRPTAIEE